MSKSVSLKVIICLQDLMMGVRIPLEAFGLVQWIALNPKLAQFIDSLRENSQIVSKHNNI